jgi:hypothetical protein
MFTCYDCGRTIPEGHVYHRRVYVGDSHRSGFITGANVFISGHTHQYAQVPLCPRCVRQFDRDKEKGKEIGSDATMYVCIGIAILVPLLILGLLIALYFILQH